MKKRGIRTGRGDLNREIEVTNQKLRQLKLDIQWKLKPVERRLGTLKKHLEQSDIYFRYKGKKPLTETGQILFTAARDYLKGVMNGKTTLPLKTWKEEYTRLTAGRKTLNQRYIERGQRG